ncbi:MAG TPA: class I adenylate-forming enzyme family protein, partial [Kofleriaceae bacterium]|nr:class I adenylate-forming enzyme family protein [Kofleriaceae bacterium]
MLNGIRRRVDRALFFGKVLRATGVAAPPPSRLLDFVKSARNTKLGPHVAPMFHAAAHPDKEALVEYGERGVRRLTWSELDATVNRLAHALVERGVQGGGRVALMLPNCIEYLIAQQALARLGATAVQIGYRLKVSEIAFILQNSEPVATIVHADHASVMDDARAETRLRGPQIVVGGAPAASSTNASEWARALAAASPTLPRRTRGGDGGGVIVYTSGTTGKPKGALRRSTGDPNQMGAMLQFIGYTSDDIYITTGPLYH